MDPLSCGNPEYYVNFENSPCSWDSFKIRWAEKIATTCCIKKIRNIAKNYLDKQLNDLLVEHISQSNCIPYPTTRGSNVLTVGELIKQVGELRASQ